MAVTHEITPAHRAEIVLLERKARDVLIIVGTMEALLRHHEGGATIAITPTEYVNTLKRLLTVLSEPEEK